MTMDVSMMEKGEKYMIALWNRQKLELNDDINPTFESTVNKNIQPNKRHIKNASHLKS